MQLLAETLERGHNPGHPGSSLGWCPLGLSCTPKLESSGLHFQLNKIGTVIWSGLLVLCVLLHFPAWNAFPGLPLLTYFLSSNFWQEVSLRESIPLKCQSTGQSNRHEKAYCSIAQSTETRKISPKGHSQCCSISSLDKWYHEQWLIISGLLAPVCNS